jgi:hypothetical protein
MFSKSFLIGAGVAAVSMFALAAGAQAGPVNLGFETGDLSGWTASGFAGAVTSYGAFTPAYGKYLGFIQAGCGADVYCSLSQTFSLTAGETIKGVVGFQANDYLPYNDYADLNVNGTVLFTSDVAAVGDYGNTGWVPWSYTAASAGSYTLTLEVANNLDNALSSGAVLDSAVPEPSTWAMMALGFAGLAFAAARRAKKVVAAVA